MVHGLTDIFRQVSGHFQSMYVVGGLFQNAVVSHEVSGSDPRFVRVQVDRRGVGCMTTGGALMREERGKCQTTEKKKKNWQTVKIL